MAQQEHLEPFDMLKSLFAWDSEGKPVFEVEEQREFGDKPLELLLSLIHFSCSKDITKNIPSNHRTMFQLIRLSDFVGCDAFVEAAGVWLRVNTTITTP